MPIHFIRSCADVDLSSLGGSPVFIETAATPTAKSEGGGGVNVVTGQLGNVCPPPPPLPPHPSISPGR